MQKYTLAIGVALAIVLLISPMGWAAPKHQVQFIITYPTDGMTLSGAIDVTGTATHANISHYQVRYSAGAQETGGSQWVDFAYVEGVQVESGVLGTWDTTTVPDGQYTLALAVWGMGDGPYVAFVRNLTVNNSQPVEVPTPEEATPTPEPMPTVVAATPTPVSIEQPPTSTPRPSPTPSEEDAGAAGDISSSDDGSQFDIPVNFSLLRMAFFTGGMITVSLFSLWGIYIFIKALVRWIVRQRTTYPK